MSKLLKAITAVSAAAITVTSLAAPQGLKVSSAVCYKIADLINESKAKTFGRYSLEDGKMTCYWSAGGFEINLNTKKDETLRVNCLTNSKIYLAAFVDGEQLDREAAITENVSDLLIPLKKGKHTVRVLRDTPNSSKSEQYFYFDSIETGSEILEAAKPTDLYIEVIGASTSCGCGALGSYTKGQAWKVPEDHSAVKSYAYRTVTKLGCDYSFVCRGGIGLLSDTSASQEAVTSSKKTTMQEIYNYTNGNRDMENGQNEYDFARKPDIIIFQLGNNDTTAREDEWKGEVISFISQLREKNGQEPAIVWMGNIETHYLTVSSILKNELSNDPNLYAFKCVVGGSGSAALATQSKGHPSAAEQFALSLDLIRYLKNNGLIKEDTQKADRADAQNKEATPKAGVKKAALIGGGAALGVAAVTAAAFVLVKKRKRGK